jgi:predicted phosphodiesterase
MKKIFILSVIVLGILNVLDAQNVAQNQGPRFVVISDTHFENNNGEGAAVKVPKALKILLSKKPKPDAIFVVGDLTNRGYKEQYEQLLSVFGDKNNVPEDVPVYYMMGYNHDKSSSGGQEMFQEIVNKPLHQYIEIKGYPFITLSEGGSHNNAYNEEVKTFLKEKLADAAQKYPGKPIFVFTHIPPLNTCYGSGADEGWGTDIFAPVLSQYPQVIIFSGHSHFPLGDPRSIHQNVFTSINDGSLTYSEVEPNVVDNGIHPANSENVTEGMIVNVLKNGNVEMERWDTYRDEEILPKWLVEAPHDGSRFTYKNRNGLPAPVFKSKAVPTVRLLADSCVVTFPQATDNEVVHRYLVEIVDGQQVVASFREFSQFYLNSMTPKTLNVGFSKLPYGKKLTARVTAIDSYNNQSKPIISKPFTLSLSFKPSEIWSDTNGVHINAHGGRILKANKRILNGSQSGKF